MAVHMCWTYHSASPLIESTLAVRKNASHHSSYLEEIGWLSRQLVDPAVTSHTDVDRRLRMERYGLVHFEAGPNRQLASKVNYSGVELEVSFQA